MQIRLLDQPWPSSTLVWEEWQRILRRPQIERHWIAVAWVKQSGLELVAAELDALKHRLPDERTRALVGVDAGGATIEGLERTIELFGQARVYFDSRGRPPRTFHPKVYFAEESGAAYLLLGSANATLGGLGNNYETTLAVEMELANDQDRQLRDQLQDWYERHWTARGAAMDLTAQSLPIILADPRIVVGSERTTFGDAARSRTRAGPGAFTGGPGDLRSAGGTSRGRTGQVADPADDSVQPPRGAVAPADPADARVLIAPYTLATRWNQIEFNVRVLEEFFGIRRASDSIVTQGLRQNGSPLPPLIRRRVIPTSRNRRIEFREPDGRPDPRPGSRPMLVVLEYAPRRYRFISLVPADTPYSDVERLRLELPPFGRGTSETHRVVTTWARLKVDWPACPLMP